MQENDYPYYMQRCLQLAELGQYYVAPNPMVGAVLVDADGTIIGEGWHQRWGEAHAEVNCFRDAERRGYSDFSGCTLFVSLEPCSHYGKTPPCARLIIEKRVSRVVAGMQDPNPAVAGRGLRMLQDAGIEVVCGVEEQACRFLNRRFLCLHEQHRPYIILKWAETKDGFLDRLRDEDAARRGEGPLVISSPITKQLVHQMRAENMAIMVGTRTALLDNPSLRTTRWAGRHPVRVLLDRHHRVPGDSRIFSPDAETIVYSEHTDPLFVVSDLAQRGIHSLIVEGGAQLLNSMLSADLWDEIHVEIAPITIGEGVAAPDRRCWQSRVASLRWVGDHQIIIARHSTFVAVPGTFVASESNVIS